MTARQTLLTAAVLLSFLPPVASAQCTIDPLNPYVYAANCGWIDATAGGTNGAAIGQYYCAGHLWSANCGWIALGSGAPSNGFSYANDSASDWGVNHDGEGRLSGYAYAANIGWVLFEQTHGRPRLDLRTGNLSGWAYGANIGWLSLSNAQACARNARLNAGPDIDGDGLADAYEFARAGSLGILSGLAGHDADGDGATDLEELLADTDPVESTNHLRITSLSAQGPTNRVTWSARPTRLYRLQAAAWLGPGTGAWSSAANDLLGPPSGASMEHTVTDATQTARFYRVQAIVPLSE